MDILTKGPKVITLSLLEIENNHFKF